MIRCFLSPTAVNIEFEFKKLDAEIDSIPVEKILDTMGIPKNYMELLNM